MKIDTVYAMIDTEERRIPMTLRIARQFPVNPRRTGEDPSFVFKVMNSTILKRPPSITEWWYFSQDEACWYIDGFLEAYFPNVDKDVPLVIL